jgi:class 3 adenylate cyclase
MRRRICVLVADLAERVGTNVGAPIDVVRAVEIHEQRVLDAVRHYAGVVDRFDGDRVVAAFFMEGDGSGTLLAAQAALEITRLSGGGGTAVGLDAGEALCGMFGVDHRYRVQGEVVRRAARAARTAASRNLGVAATEVVCRSIETRLEVRPIGKDSELLLFEIVSERRRDGEGMSEERTIPR